MSIIARAIRTISDLNDGRSITAVDVEYYLSTSSSALSGGSWSTSAPAWVNGRYMWSRTKTSYSSGDPTYSAAACITGAAGSTGSTGTGVASITAEFYLSTSKSTQAGGLWVTTPPTWSAGKYMWTRSKIVYANPSSTAYTTPVCDTGWEAANNIEVGGRNYAQNSAWKENTNGWTLHTNVTRDETYSMGGAFCLKSAQSGLVSDSYRGASVSADAFMPVAVGDTLTGSVWVRVDDAASFQSNIVALLIDVLDTAGVKAQETTYGTLTPMAADNGKWIRVTASVTVTGESAANARIAFWVRRNGTCWFACPKLEKGNKATDWTPAPEDFDETVDRKITDVRAEITNLGDSIRSEVSTTYAEKTDLGTLQTQVSTMAEQTSTDFTWVTQTINQIIEDAAANQQLTDAQFETIQTYMTFGADGLRLGKTGNPVTVRILNDRIAFYMNETEVAYFSNNKLYVTQAQILSRLQIGKFAYEPQPNGNMSLVFTG